MTTNPIASLLGHTFECLATAERELDRLTAEATSQRQRDRLRHAIRFACPTPPLRGKSGELYRAHCLELYARAQRLRGPTQGPAFLRAMREAMAAPTAAELLAVISEASTRAPLDTQAAAAMSTLFCRCGFGSGDSELNEPWEGSTEELLGELSRKLGSLRHESSV